MLETIDELIAVLLLRQQRGYAAQPAPDCQLQDWVLDQDAVGNANRFLTSPKLVAYLGLDPKVRQSGEAPARSGWISKRGSASTRWALVEAAWTATLQPGPLHAFYERTRARRGHGKAIVATARKLAVLFW